MKKIAILSLVLLLTLAVGCSAGLKDGDFSGTYTSEENGSTTTVNLTIKDQKIVACELIAKDAQGNIKGENYGKDAGDKNYQLAQKAVAGMQQYPAMLIETQNVDDVEAVSGASISLIEFRIAVKAALDQAR